MSRVPLERQMPDRPVVRLRLAVCVTVGTGVAKINLGGTDIDAVPYLIAPTANDVVYVFQDGGSLLILGPVV